MVFVINERFEMGQEFRIKGGFFEEGLDDSSF